MRRRARRQDSPISLFPMFNILVAVLGTLLFIQITVTVLSLGISKSIAFVHSSGANRVGREPVYVEWTGESLILHPQKLAVRLSQDLGQFSRLEELYAYLDDEVADTAFGALFDEVRRPGASRYVIVLARPSGFDHFRLLRAYLEAREIPIGYEPLEESVAVQVN